MAEATTPITVTPKQLGRHLRSIRRKKGLSLSEVARGAGLSRRELVAYERGKAPIPESDLWVLAGSCGVDVAELMPSASSLELTAAANGTSVGDTVSQLRRSQEDAGITPYLHTLQKLQALPPGKRIPVKERELEEIATALGSTPRSIEQKLQDVLQVSPGEAERLRAMILVPPNSKGKPRALAAPPSALAAAAEARPAEARPVEAPAVAAVPTPPAYAEPLPAPPPPPPPPSPLAPATPAEPVHTFQAAPAAFLDQPRDAPLDPVGGHNVDVFEELARLPEPVPLGDPAAPLPDLLAPPTPFSEPLVGVPVSGAPEGSWPEGAVELVDSALPGAAVAGGSAWSAADAPPIDVAMRQGSATWDLGQPPLEARLVTTEPASWETGGWQPPAPDGTNGVPGGFWEGTDDWTPTPATDAVETPAGEPMVVGEATWAGSTWDADTWSPAPPDAGAAPSEVDPWSTEEWPREPADRGAWEHQPDPAAVDTGFYVDWGTTERETPPIWDGAAEAPVDPTADLFGAPEPPPVADLWSQPGATDAPADLRDAPPAWDAWVHDAETVDPAPTSDDAFAAPPVWETWTPPTDPVAVVESEPFVVDADGTIEPAPISWRADAPDEEPAAAIGGILADEALPSAVGPVAPPEPMAPTTTATPTPEWTEPTPAWTPAAEPVVPVAAPAYDAPAYEMPAPVYDAPAYDAPVHDALVHTAPRVDDDFVVAGPDWQLGNALPLVEVRGQGGLVMRRADERWALADLTTTPDFVAEVEVDFRSGPGLGVLFRASLDDEGRMSGYSFDVDPIYDGGGFLVRQWHADRELWNPIARVSGDDPTAMYGTLLVRLEVVGEHLSAQVNGVEVLTVENLKQASTDRGRDAATGDRIGVQAWSSSDLVIDTVRVASR